MDCARSFVVVGGGISGLYAALLLARSGANVRVLERGERPGGLAAATTFRGIPCDLGSHRLHPEALRQPLFREMHRERPFLRRPRRGLLLFASARVPYPPSPASMLRALGARTTVELALGFLTRESQRRKFASWERDRVASDGDEGFESFVMARVGRAAYEAFYKPYVEKVWGLPPAELSQTVAKKRVSSTRPLDLFQGIGNRLRRRGASATAASGTFVYPAAGTSSIVTFLEERLRELGVPIECKARWTLEDRTGETVLFAGDLRDLVDAPLEHRGLYLVYLALPTSRVGTHETYYSPDLRFWFGRVSELQNYSPELRRERETVLCVEIPEGAWGRGVSFVSGSHLHELLAQLHEAGIVPAKVRPIEAKQIFVPKVYPLYRRGWIAEWREAMTRIAALGDVLPFGRQGLFLHCNLDHCAELAEHAVAHALQGRSTEQWVRRAERYLELRVRD